MCRARLRVLTTFPFHFFKPRFIAELLVAIICLMGLALPGHTADLIIHERETPLQLSPFLSGNAPNSPIPGAMTPTPPRQQATPVEEDLPPIATIDLTTPPTDLWQRMRNGFSMPNLESPLVAERQAYYLNRPGAIKVMTQRSRRYLYHIVTELEKRGMPTELALLPMVESAYNPLAQSPAKALGMWQFIPSTGKNYNLAQNWWLDQRRDIIASTNAALDYLQTIYEMHGDWHLALASYNWGENAVGKAVQRNQARGLPTDYLSLTMPGETRYYVPKLQALKNIIADPALFGIRLDPIPNKPYFDTVDMPATMDVATAAKLAEIPLDEFMALNPAYSRPIIQNTGNSSLVLPTDRVSVFHDNLMRYESQDKPLSLWKTTVLKPKEKLDAVAARYGISSARLKQFNSIGPRTKVGAGMTLLVPASPAATSEITAHLPQPPVEPAAPVVRSRKQNHAAPDASRGKANKHDKKSAVDSNKHKDKDSKARSALQEYTRTKGKSSNGKTTSSHGTSKAAGKGNNAKNSSKDINKKNKKH